MYSFHIHSMFSDGKNTPEEIVLAAIEKGLVSIGFTDHGYTAFDVSYCITDTAGYRTEIQRLKEKYKDQIQIYLGVEEDASSLINREQFDYIIGSSHYLYKDHHYFSIDGDYDELKKCLGMFQNDVASFAENYYHSFCKYIIDRKPDIIGHFDLITKFDEVETSLFLQNNKYNQVAEKYITIAAESGCIFEINTGAIARGYRTTPYPSENLLHTLKKLHAKIMISSDSHSIETLDFAFKETKQYLRDIGFHDAYALINNQFKKYEI